MPFVRQSTLDQLEADALARAESLRESQRALIESLRQNATLLRLLAEQGVSAPPVFEPMPSVEQVDRKLAKEQR